MAKAKNTHLLILGFVAGFMSAFLGIGGGVIIVPVMVLLFKYGIKKAIGTSLATIVPTSLVGVTTHYIIDKGNIYFLAAIFIVLGSVAGAKLGAVLANKINSKYLAALFGVLLLVTGLRQIGVLNIEAQEVSYSIQYPFFVVLGLIAGICSALFGIGGGIVMVPGLSFLFGFTMHEAVATSLAVIVPTSLAGAVFHARFNNIDKKAIEFLVPTALAGAVLGAIASNALDTSTLQFIFGIFIMLCSAKMFLSLREMS